MRSFRLGANLEFLLVPIVVGSIALSVGCSDSSSEPETEAASPLDAGATVDSSISQLVDASLGVLPDAGQPSAVDAAAGSDSAPEPSDAAVASDGATDAPPGPQTVTIRFKAKVGVDDFHCATTYAAQGSMATSVQPSDLRFYVDDVRLVDDKGAETQVTFDVRAPWQTADVALLDFEDGTGECNNGNADTNAVITGTVPPGKYRGIIFSNGVPESLEHGDPTTAPAPLQSGGMTWGWLYGYKFFDAQLVALPSPDAGVDASATGIGLFHLGSVGCTNADDGGDPDFGKPPTVACSQANRNLVRLPDFDPDTSSIVLDVGAVFAATDLSGNDPCHSEGDSCPSLFASVGLSYQTGAQLPSQSAYRVE